MIAFNFFHHTYLAWVHLLEFGQRLPPPPYSNICFFLFHSVKLQSFKRKGCLLNCLFFSTRNPWDIRTHIDWMLIESPLFSYTRFVKLSWVFFSSIFFLIPFYLLSHFDPSSPEWITRDSELSSVNRFNMSKECCTSNHNTSIVLKESIIGYFHCLPFKIHCDSDLGA